MVLLAASVCNKAGKAIISRQFVEMTRARIEGLLAAFPKLMGTGKQHTFVETESVRYVYQPLEKLYVLLITTKASNILEDLETLRLFARVVPEYCKVLEETEILDQAFPLIFAFDEIVALGYRESVNLAQIRTFTEMDSHEEKVYQAVRQTQEKEAKEHMKQRARELTQQRKDAIRSGKPTKMTGMGSSGRQDSPVIDTSPTEPTKPSYTAPAKAVGGGRGMKLGSKTKDVESFVDQLKSEGEVVASQGSANKSSAVAKATTPVANQEPVHLKIEEKLSLSAGRDGGLQNMEIHGMALLKITDESYGKTKVYLGAGARKDLQMQPHPNIDKKLFAAENILALKNMNKPFPVNQDAGVLRWRFQTNDDSNMPLSINCWPNETGSGCDVNIEYELEQDDMELNDVTICIPLPSGVGAPVVNDCEGDYRHDSRHNILEWSLPLIDSNNKSGAMEFSIGGHPDDFFPINVSFVSKKSYCNIELTDIQLVDSESSIKYSTETLLYVDKYEIV